MNSLSIALTPTDIRNFYLKPQVILLMALVLTLSSTTVWAQSAANTLSKGERVKVKAPTVKRGNLFGRVADTSPDVLTIATKDTTYRFVYKSIEKLSVYDGKKRSTGKGMLWGAAAGALVLGTVAVATNDNGENTCDENPGWFCGGNIIQFSDTEAFVIGAAAGGLLGAVAGGVVGVFIRSPRWKEVPVDVALGMAPVPAYATQNGRSFNTGISLRFSL